MKTGGGTGSSPPLTRAALTTFVPCAFASRASLQSLAISPRSWRSHASIAALSDPAMAGAAEAIIPKTAIAGA